MAARGHARRNRPDIEVWRDAVERIALFDASAEAYDRWRAGYPEELFDALVGLLPHRARVLEIGAGTGKASLPLARRGVRLSCLEPGAALASFARAKLASYPNANLVEARFEEWQGEPGTYDLVVAADAWHWIDQQAGPTRAADLLRPGGYLALAWHARTGLEPAAAERDLLALVIRHVENGETWMRRTGDEGDVFLAPIDASGRFEPIERRRFPTGDVVDGETLAGELGTFSWVLALPGPIRAALLRDVVDLVRRQPAGTVVRRAVNVLYLARRKGA